MEPAREGKRTAVNPCPTIHARKRFNDRVNGAFLMKIITEIVPEKNLKTALSERRNARLAERAQTRVCGELTPPAAVLVGMILEVELGRVEVSERLALRLRLRVHVQLGEQRDARKPQLQNGAETDELITPI